LKPERSGPGVFAEWNKKKEIWEELDRVLAQRFVAKGAYMVAPPEFADKGRHYKGYRAGLRRTDNGIWKFAYFVDE
jgi:hypothetical protein